jgi:hypothetical protein
MEGEASSQAMPAAASKAATPPAIASLARFESFGWTTTYEPPQAGQLRDAVASVCPHTGHVRSLGAKAA